MLHAEVSLFTPPTSGIQEVVLRGSRDNDERYLRMRAVHFLRRELRCQHIWMRRQVYVPEVSVWLADWQNPRADVLNFDRLLHSVSKEGEFRLVLRTDDWLTGTQAALEILNRYQRMLPVARYHELPEPLESSDEAIDIWRWLLRLKPMAGRPLQRAAFKRNESALRRAQSSDGLRLLRDAADLSFFSMRSWQYLRAWGYEQTQSTVERRLGRMSEAAVCRALGTRQPAAIAGMIDACLDLVRGGPAMASPAMALP